MVSNISNPTPQQQDAYQKSFGKSHEIGGEIITFGIREILSKTTPLPGPVIEAGINTATHVNVTYILPRMKHFEDKVITPVLKDIFENNVPD